MASKFIILTDFIFKINGDIYGEWIVDKANDGSLEHRYKSLLWLTRM